MTSIANNSVAKVVAVAVVLVMAFAFAMPAKADTTSDLQAQINSLLATIAGLQAQLGSTSSSSSSAACTFTTDLTMGSKGTAVTCLQNYLIGKGFAIPAGATGFFGAQTQSAVKAWQAANGITPAAGYFGAKSRAAFAAMGGSTTTTTTTTTPPGTGVAVAACPTQPTNSLAPQGATRVKLTCFTLTAGNDGDVTVNSVTVQKDGLFTNAGIAGVTLLRDDTGTQLGVAKTLNSNNQATIGEPFKIMKGSSVKLYVAVNEASSLASYAGESQGLSVVAVNTAATVTGALPIMGSHQVTNATLTVGALVTADSSAFASNSPTTTKEVGVTGYKASGLRFTASSAEDVLLKSIRWNQVGSVTGSDLANIVTYVNGTAYPAVASADGKYFESSLGSGVVIAKGNSVEVYVQYDIVGGSGRTVQFNIEKNTDIYGIGQTYGYGANATGGSTGTPYEYGQQVTVSGATVTTIAKDTAVAAQNIAANVPNQVLGGFYTDIKGESMTVQSMAFTIATSGVWNSSSVITNITLVDENGAVKAGPIDEATTCTSGCTITFTDSVTIPVGVKHWRLLGKLGSGAPNGGTVAVTTVPSSGWSNVKGDVTGNSISLSANGSFTMNTMTVKSAALAVTRGTSPSSRTVIAGSSGIVFANLNFDASQSGEDVRFSSIPLSLTFATGVATDITSCLVVDGTTGATLSDTSFNPSGSSPYTVTATLSQPVTVAKGTVKVLGIKCNVTSGATTNGTFQWDHGTIGNFSVTGISSGSSFTATAPSDTAVVVTVGTGAVSVSLDASSPSYTLVAAGSTDVVAGSYKFSANNEAINLSQLGLKLTNTASSSISDVVKASIYDGATKVGEAFFTTDAGPGSASVATSTFTTPVQILTSADKTLTVKLDLASISSNGAATSSGHLVAVDFISGQGTGVDSGNTYNLGAGNGSTAVAGIRVMKSFPVVSADSSLASTGLADGRLGRFKVTADSHGPISLTEFNLRFATTSVTLSNVNIWGFTDSSYSSGITGVSSGGQLSATGQPMSVGWASGSSNLEFSFTTAAGASTTIQVPAGQTRYFEIRATVAGVTTGSNVVTTLVGDTRAGFIGGGRYSNPLVAADESAPALDTVSEAAFIWSPNSTTTVSRTDADWTNGYQISGLPSNGLIFNRSI